MNGDLTCAAFTELVGAPFCLHLETGEKAELELVEVTPLKAYEHSPRQDPFSLLFRGSADLHLPQRIYRVENEQLGELELFLVPIQPDSSGTYFEAVFN